MSFSELPRVSVVIPAYGRPRQLVDAVTSALAQDYPRSSYEVIVVDSSPTDDVRNAVERLNDAAGGRLRYVWKQPEGPGPSRNLGVSLTTGSVVAFLDSDCRATAQWLRRGVATFDSAVGLVQGAVLPDPLARRGVFTYYLLVDKESLLYETANMFYRREALEQAGGFPRDLTPTADRPMGGEDVEVGWRVKRLGWRSRFAPEALVYHEVVPISIWGWIVVKRLFIFPLMMKRVPELRRLCYGRYFYDEAQCFLVLGLVASCFIASMPWIVLFWIPYAISRGTEPTASLRGIKRPLRVGAYLLRDLMGLALLIAGSIRYRTVLL